MPKLPAVVDDEDVARIRRELLEMEIDRLQAERREVRALIPNWRGFAMRTASDAVRNTWILAAEQLERVTTQIPGE